MFLVGRSGPDFRECPLRGGPPGRVSASCVDPETTNQICANGQFQVQWLIILSSGIAIWAVQDGVDDGDDTDDGDWGRCWR